MTQPLLKAIAAPPVTVLLVEPEVLARMILADYLRGCGYVVHETASGEEGLEALRGQMEIDVVLAEINEIGSMNGFEFAHTVRDLHPGVEVLLTASLANAAERCHELCEHRIVKKPYTPQEIVNQINILRQKRRGRGRF